MDAETAKKLWEANRVQKPTDRSATYAQLELELRLREAGAPRTLNFSGMDLRGLSLTRYASESGHDLALFRDPALSERTMLALDTFRAQGHTGSVTCLAVTDDGLCVSGSWDNTLRVWDLRSGECLHTLEGHSDSVSCLALTSDGLCVSGSVDSTLRIWDIHAGQRLDVLRSTEIDVSAMNFSKANLSPDLARALWQNGATLSPAETEKQQRLLPDRIARRAAAPDR